MSRFVGIVHASIWDVVLLVVLGGYGIVYFFLWTANAWQARKRKK